MNRYLLIWGVFCIWVTYTTHYEYPFKRLRFVSEEYVAYVELQMKATATDQKFDLISNLRLVEYNYDQEAITKADMYPFLSQGEITLTTFQHKLGLQFDFVKTDNGYDMSLEWASFGEQDGWREYKSLEKKTISIPVGSSTISNIQMEYFLSPEPHAGQKISITIVEAKINIISVTDIKDKQIKNEHDKTFDDHMTINFGLEVEKPKRISLPKVDTKEFDS